MLKKNAGATDDDTIVLVWGNKQDVTTGASEVVIRAKEATIGVPSETRQALRDGTNGFERILPGPDRMYPDTDLPPKRITREHLGRIRTTVPAPFWENQEWLSSLGVPSDLLVPLSYSPLAPLFRKAVQDWRIGPTLAAVVLIQYPKRISKLFKRRVMFSKETMEELLFAFKEGKFTKEGFLPLMTRLADGSELSRQEFPPLCPPEELRTIAGRVRDEIASLTLHNPEKRSVVTLGGVMQKVRGRIDGNVVAGTVRSILGEEKR
jgi:glutamyl-tRNA(Gln) amidotransferase subunit E